jgi:ParB-like chromosome segregation protein Spo0J
MVKPREYKVTNRAAMVGRFIEVSPGDLIPAVRRTRKHPNQKWRTLRESVRLQGVISPIIVNSANVIVDGQLRVEIAIQLRLRTVPVMRVEHLSDAELRAFGIAANRMPATADWDMEELASSLRISGRTMPVSTSR